MGWKWHLWGREGWYARTGVCVYCDQLKLTWNGDHCWESSTAAVFIMHLEIWIWSADSPWHRNIPAPLVQRVSEKWKHRRLIELASLQPWCGISVCPGFCSLIGAWLLQLKTFQMGDFQDRFARCQTWNFPDPAALQGYFRSKQELSS